MKSQKKKIVIQPAIKSFISPPCTPAVLLRPPVAAAAAIKFLLCCSLEFFTFVDQTLLMSRQSSPQRLERKTWQIVRIRVLFSRVHLSIWFFSSSWKAHSMLVFSFVHDFHGWICFDDDDGKSKTASNIYENGGSPMSCSFAAVASILCCCCWWMVDSGGFTSEKYFYALNAVWQCNRS